MPFPGKEHPSIVALQTGQEVNDVVMGVYNPRMGCYRWISINAVPIIRHGEDKPYQVYTIFDDITERKFAEEALLKNENELRIARDLLEQVTIGTKVLIATVDKDFR